jgi:hypothetical protein
MASSTSDGGHNGRPSGRAGWTPTVRAAVAELREFIAELGRRPDIVVKEARVGDPAAPDKLAALRLREGIPEELVALYAEMDGARVEWRFIEPDGAGCLDIPEIDAPYRETRFADDEETYMGFGEGCTALLLDAIQPEGRTWLLRGGGEVRIVFASAGDGEEAFDVADSIAEYLRAAMHHGFVHYWPHYDNAPDYLDTSRTRKAIDRFRAAPRPPRPVHPGARVQFVFFAEGGRGDVLALHEAPPNRRTEIWGRQFVLVRFDEGSVGWLPLQQVKAYEGTDAYERLRNPAFDLAAAARGAPHEVQALVHDLARAIGPLSSYSTMTKVGRYSSNARRAAGLLSTRPFTVAFSAVTDLCAAALAAGLDLDERREMTPSADDFDDTQWCRGKYSIAATLEGLYSGLFLLACRESTRRGVPMRDLVTPAEADRFTQIAQDLADAGALDMMLARRAMLEGRVRPAPNWDNSSYAGEVARELELPTQAQLFLTGSS